MLSRNKAVEEKLKSLLNQQDAELKREYDWIENFQHINFWDFLSINYLELDRFFTLLDIETGPTSGWERFVEAIGLNLWEDRKWCHQYHDGAGPTRAALCKILEKNSHDSDFSLSGILMLIKEMDRFDILLQIDWGRLVDKYNSFRLEGNKQKAPEKEDCRTFVLKLHNKLENTLLVKSGNYGQHAEEEDVSSSIINKEIKNKQGRKQNSGKKVKSSEPTILLTYANDAEEYATKVSAQLKSDGIKRKKVNVLLLHCSKVKQKLLSDNSNILHSWFNQVRYIVPILSPLYVRQIQNLNFDNLMNSEEALRNRLIYRLTLDQFVNFGSRNYRCRPICPDQYSDVLSNSVIANNGLFSIIWSTKPDKIEELGRVLMDEPLVP